MDNTPPPTENPHTKRKRTGSDDPATPKASTSQPRPATTTNTKNNPGPSTQGPQRRSPTASRHSSARPGGPAKGREKGKGKADAKGKGKGKADTKGKGKADTKGKGKADTKGKGKAAAGAGAGRGEKGEGSSVGQGPAADSDADGGPAHHGNGESDGEGGAKEGGSGDEGPARKRRFQWGVPKKDVPDAEKQGVVRSLSVSPPMLLTFLKDGFRAWIRALCGIPTQADVLPSATPHLQHYDKRFNIVPDIKEHVAELVDASRIAVSVRSQEIAKAVRDAALKKGGKIANLIGRIPEVHLSLAFDAVQSAGLQTFCPDVAGPPQSVYNQIHRHICVYTFQTVATIFGLDGLQVPLSLARNYGLLSSIYDNYMKGRLTR
ncbi:hypothetical protein C8F01DRAFT_1231523 [Mycena amicta]|nr:hypothetical protein C8F01DRAFT_1231523 [Mycena amicta]